MLDYMILTTIEFQQPYILVIIKI